MRIGVVHINNAIILYFLIYYLETNRIGLRGGKRCYHDSSSFLFQLETLVNGIDTDKTTKKTGNYHGHEHISLSDEASPTEYNLP